MSARIAVACVSLAAGIAGTMFGPVFGWWRLVPSIAVGVLAVILVAEICRRVPALAAWRPVIATVAGLLGVVELELWDTTLAGLPTAATGQALLTGVTDSWQLALESTWPTRADAGLLLFVPLVVLVAAVLGVELLRWPVLAVLPSLAVLGLSQMFAALTGIAAITAALVYAAVVAVLFAVSRPGARHSRTVALAVPTVVLGLCAAIAVPLLAPSDPAYSLQDNRSARTPLPRTTNPLAEIAARLEQPETPVFTYTGGAPVDRWRLVVLEEFTGTRWTAPQRYRHLGERVGPAAGAPVTPRSARVTMPDGGPWLPSQAMPATVTGVAPLIDPASGMLLLPETTGPVDYELSWWEPEIDTAALADAKIDASVPPGGLGAVPPAVADLARTATAGAPPSFRAALVLERHLQQNYRAATGTGLPTGHGWSHLREFLLDTRQGTSEQFAAAYVALARLAGIPARLAVGFRAPQGGTGPVVVRNKDVLAWPEVAVAGLGWVPLDPMGAASGPGRVPTPLAAATAKVRAELPPPSDRDTPPPADGPHAAAPEQPDDGPATLLVLLGLLLIGIVGAVPLAKAIRTAVRRRRGGVHGVVSAWWEARDLLRTHGEPATPGTTVRDLAGTATGATVAHELLELAAEVDLALWSSTGATDRGLTAAWDAVRGVRRGLARRPLPDRVRAAFNPRSLLGQRFSHSVPSSAHGKYPKRRIVPAASSLRR
ncbi:transglutaminase superfamily protein [Herbihabitans rhizosphaerae]|uniref:Transglutaminase superfamily protein n=1 Tax=Herbihabitans rhizosphaerae TaxID=1872711 RepID=A0A4Q7KJH4_9PSEU|nr:transglutaminase domain-containing protein [Herbihabitans rhizosphaerae]RZS34395.1 transglutaminase superfamily protein [Herbihabitans rhizosphaerae]